MRETSFLMFVQDSPSDSINNVDYWLIALRQKFKYSTYCWRYFTLEILNIWFKLCLTCKLLFCSLSSIVPENYVQASMGSKQLITLTSCNISELQQWPAWENIHNDVISATYMLVATNGCVIRIWARSTRVKLYLVLKNLPKLPGLWTLEKNLLELLCRPA